MTQTAQLETAAADLEAAFGPETAGLEALPNLGDMCKIYQRIKGPLERILPLLELLPWGATVAKAIRLLIKVADTVCPA